MTQHIPGQHMAPDEFRRLGREMVDFIADYWERVETFPVASRVRPGETAARLPEEAPETGEPFEAVMQDVENIILPGLTHWQSPNFFAYFPSNISGPSVLGEMLSAGLGVQGMSWATSPACTELETRVMDWMARLCGLPEKFLSAGPGGGVIQDSASSAAICAILAAREKALARHGRDNAPRLTLYLSEHTHSSVEKGARIAGIGHERLRFVPCDETGAMRPSPLAEMLSRDRQDGFLPFFVAATIGTTSSNAMDPVRAVAEATNREDVWLHVDGAMSGTAAVCPEFRHLFDGLELADSYCFNPHKWMFVNFDCDCFWVADRRPLIQALSILPEYLRNKASETGAVIDYRDWQLPLGRRFRALKLWFVLRWYGADGLRAHIREHVRLARLFAALVQDDPAWEVAAPVPLNLVCFRHRAGDETNQKIMEAANTAGRIFLSHTKLDGRHTLRFCVGQTGTRESHVREAWAELKRCLALLA